MFFRGYVETKDKQCVEKFKGRTDFKTYEQVKSLPEFAGILAEDTILVDLDDEESSDVLFKVVQDYSLNCRVYRTTRGKHFLFKNSGVGGCKTHCTLAIGLKADIKVGVKSSYEVLKYGGVEREILYDTAENEQAQPLPRWLFPVRSKMAFLDMEEGDGRNQALFNYILTLQSNDFTVEEARETIRIINKYVSDLLGLLPFAQGLDLTPEVGRILNSKKVSDHHAIIPTSEFVKQGFTGLAESECKLMNLACSKLLCAIAAPHEYETVTAVFFCAGNEFTAKGKTVLVPGWKEIDQRFRSTMKADGKEEAESLNTLPEMAEGQSFRVTSTVSEHFTSPPKAYTEDTLLSAMERAGAEDMPEEAERKGLGTPATRAAILEKLVQMGFVQRKGKQLVPTKDGINLAVVLPESLTSPALTAEWENRLTEIAKGNADPDEFMAEIEAQVRQLVKTYSCISADKQNLFQSERVIIGKCPRCSENVYEGKKNFYCGNRSCQFVMWKNDRFFEQRKKAFTPKIASALLKNGKAKVKGLYSEKTGKTYDATVLLADTGGKYVNYRVERKE